MSIETTLTPALVERYTAAGYWGTQLWPDYIDATATAAPDRIAIVDARGTLSYRELCVLTQRLALHMLALGIGKEDRFGLQLPNWRHLILLRFALARIGAVALPIPSDWGERDVQYVLATTEASGVIVPYAFRGRQYHAEQMAMAQDLPNLRTRLVVEAPHLPPTGWIALEALLDDAIERRTSTVGLDTVRPDANEVDIIVPTSGSSAAPKLVVRTPNCFLATTRQFVENRGFFTGEDVVAGLAPITRGMGYYVGVAGPIVCGSTMALLERFSPEAALRWLEQTRATVAVAVPTQIVKMLQLPDFDAYDLSSLRMVVNGGAAIAPGIAAEAERRFGCVVLSAYGSVEGAVPVCTAADDPASKRYHTVGQVLPGMELRIVNDAGEPLPARIAGEIVYRGPGLSLGFWRDPEAYRAMLDGDGWFRTGDLGMLDEEGYLSVVGRRKEIIIRGGINISPAEVEGLLQECPGVQQVAVVKMPDPVLGERCCAYVVPDANSAIDMAMLADFLAARGVAKYKFPERVELRSELPTTPDGGKVLRRALEEDIAHLLQAEQVAGSGHQGRRTDAQPAVPAAR